MADIKEIVTSRSTWRSMLAERTGNSGAFQTGGLGFTSSIRNVVGKGFQALADLQSNDVVSNIIDGPLTKLWRAKIVLNRVTSGMPKEGRAELKARAAAANAMNQHYAYKEYMSLAQNTPWGRSHKYVQMTGVDPSTVKPAENYTGISVNSQAKLMAEAYKNTVCIINYNSSPPTVLTLQNRPTQLSISTESTWAAIKSMGRNNPFRMYTSGDESLSFEISWYSNDPSHRDDVLKKCRLLERWTKADGYDSAPPILSIVWGNADMFSNRMYILESAPYELSNFQAAAFKDIESRQKYRRGEAASLIDLHLWPSCATQTLTFRRVTSENLKGDDIVTLAELSGYLGINADRSSGDTAETFNSDFGLSPVDSSFMPSNTL